MNHPINQSTGNVNRNLRGFLVDDHDKLHEGDVEYATDALHPGDRGLGIQHIMKTLARDAELMGELVHRPLPRGQFIFDSGYVDFHGAPINTGDLRLSRK